MALDHKLAKTHRTISTPDSTGAHLDHNKALPPRPTEPPSSPATGHVPHRFPALFDPHRDDGASSLTFYSDCPDSAAFDVTGSRISHLSHLSFAESIADDPFFQQYRSLPETDDESVDPHSRHASVAAISIDTSSTFTPTATPSIFTLATAASTVATVTPDDDHFVGSPGVGDDTVVPDVETPRHDSGRYWPPPRRESLTIGQYMTWSSQPHEMASLNIAVIGAMGVGKSGFIERVMDLSRPPLSNASQARRVVDGVAYLVTVLELDLEHFELDSMQPIQWPRQIDGHIIPRVDGALILYDVTARGSIKDLPTTLAALTNSGLPTILVANKCDVRAEDKVLDPAAVADTHPFRPCIATYQVSANDTDAAKECLDSILKAAAANRNDPPRRRAQSAANILEATLENGRPLSIASKHSRASSDLSLLQQNLSIPQSSTRGSRLGHSNSSHSSIGEEEDPAKQTVSSLLRSTGVRLDRAATDSFLDMDASDSESHRYSEDVPLLQRNDDVIVSSTAAAERPRPAGVTFGDLVDRLLQRPMSRSDHQFIDIFLCLYRQFAAPGQLLEAVLRRIDRVRQDHTAFLLTRTATQMYMIEIVARWVEMYPGDFARPATRRTLIDFVDHLETEPVFYISSMQIRRNVENNVVEDDDTGWAKSDDAGEVIPPPTSSSRMLSKEPISLPDLSNFGNLNLGISIDLDDRPSTMSFNSLLPLNQGSVYSTQFQFQSPIEYEREAMLCEPRPQFVLNKMRYRVFMETSNVEIADEMTRMDWNMFSSIRIRDFVRHVSLTGDQRDKCRSLKNVNRMVSHFNHVAKWVASMILFRDKAKHRAQCLEKFMNIATTLRTMNNYNGLAAVLAGINGMPIHRLQATRSLVAADVQKRFARLVLLMGTQKSHFAYRLAWENSSLPRIPFMPLHRRDLVSAEEGGKTMVGPHGDRINWKKFEVLGEVLMPIMRSQGTAYPRTDKNEALRELILETKLPADEEELYTRSEQLEAPGGASDGSYRKKFAWLRMGV